MKSIILLATLVFSISLSFGQQDPQMSLYVGRGLAINHFNDVWDVEHNTSVAATYRFGSTLSIVGYLDLNSFSFKGDEPPQSSGNYTLNSYLCGLKLSTRIPGSRLSPYFFGAVGASAASPSQDTVFTHHHGSLQVYHVPQGKTLTFLGAVGADLVVFDRFFVFAEIRASSGTDSAIYDMLIMWRAGIGLNLF